MSLLTGAEWRMYASVNHPALVQIMPCRLVRDKPLSEPMLGILSIGTLVTNFSENFSEIHIFSLTKVHFKIAQGNWRTTSTGWGRLTGTHRASPGKRTQLSASKLCHKSAWKVGLPYINKMAFYRMDETTTAARRLPHLRRGKRRWRTLTCGGGRWWTGVVRLFQEVACKN